MPIEIEAKFLADGPAPLAELEAIERIGDLALGPPRPVDEMDRYLDTSDGRLAAARWACRLRTRDGVVRVSLKGPPEGAGDADPSMHRRPEIEGPATDALDPVDWPESDAAATLRSLSGGGALHEWFRLRQRRTERTVWVRPGEPLGLLTLDVVHIESSGRALGTVHVVELELEPGAPERLLAFAGEHLAAMPGLTPEPRTKLEHAIELLAAA
jgi:inorganic triphosphatase YgiF